jgi:putative transposase
MPLLTLNAVAYADPDTTNILLDAMFCATKVYNGLLYEIKQTLEKSGKLDIGLKTLNEYLKRLPRAKGYHSLSAQATRDEVIGAWESFKALKANGHTQHNAPGFRRKTEYSGLRYFGDNGVWLEGNTLRLSLGLGREDKVRQVSLRIAHRRDIVWKRLVNVLLTYDKRTGFTAHLVIEVDATKPLGERKAAFDLGETQIVSAVFDDGRVLLVSGRLLKTIRRYWNKLRVKVKPPAPKEKMSKRYAQIATKETRQIDHLLHILSKHLVERCYKAGVNEIAIGDLTGIRDSIDYGVTLNQRLHAWPFAKLTHYITYKAERFGILVQMLDESYTSQTCHACGLVLKSNRKSRGDYQCACGWHVHADVNGAANILKRAFQVSPFIGRSGVVTTPAVMSLQFNLKRHIVCKSHRVPHPGCP